MFHIYWFFVIRILVDLLNIISSKRIKRQRWIFMCVMNVDKEIFFENFYFTTFFKQYIFF